MGVIHPQDSIGDSDNRMRKINLFDSKFPIEIKPQAVDKSKPIKSYKEFSFEDFMLIVNSVRSKSDVVNVIS